MKNLEKHGKKHFDKDRLANPFDDSKLIYGGSSEIDTLTVGIDFAIQELNLVNRLNNMVKTSTGS